MPGLAIYKSVILNLTVCAFIQAVIGVESKRYACWMFVVCCCTEQAKIALDGGVATIDWIMIKEVPGMQSCSSFDLQTIGKFNCADVLGWCRIL